MKHLTGEERGGLSHRPRYEGEDTSRSPQVVGGGGEALIQFSKLRIIPGRQVTTDPSIQKSVPIIQ